MVLGELWVIVKPKNKGFFKETFSKSEKKAWDEFYLGGVCMDAIDPRVSCVSKGYKAQKVKIVLDTES